MNEFNMPTLLERSRKVRDFQAAQKFIPHMFDAMVQAHGVGLAAPQIGIPLRIFVWNYQGDHGVAINPKIESLSVQMSEGTEGCLSFPGENVTIARPETVRLIAFDVNGKRYKRIVSGMLARIFQHELDHLEGVVITDYKE